MTTLTLAQQEKLRGKLFLNASLNDYTSWKVGGPAKQLYIPKDIEDLSQFLSFLHQEEPLIWLGAGTNILAPDEGIRGTVIVIKNVLNALRLEKNNMIYAEAGVMSSQLSSFANQSGFVGLEFLVGIPGTVGGALAMNAGAYQQSTWDFVTCVETINRLGERFTRYPKEYKIGYRSVEMPVHEWFLAAYFQLQKGDAEAGKNQMETWLCERKAKQPLDLPNAGSVFRNPKPLIAAQLIESCGLKEFRIGGAQVSKKHANFIVNIDQATARDIRQLIEHIQKVVFEKHGVSLIPEVKIL